MGSNFTQLTLNLLIRDYATFDNYVTGANGYSLQVLQTLAGERGFNFIYLYGGTAVGKSHLLYALGQSFINIGATVLYLSLEDRKEFSPAILQGSSNYDLICIDDVELICGDGIWEETLFHCFNQLMVSNRKLVITAKCTPQLLPLQLLDLKSRMGGGLVLRLQQLCDEDKAAALKLRAKIRGIELDDAVAKFIINRYDRDVRSLFAMLDRLDRASLVAQKRLTIPFTREVLSKENLG